MMARSRKVGRYPLHSAQAARLWQFLAEGCRWSSRGCQLSGRVHSFVGSVLTSFSITGTEGTESSEKPSEKPTESREGEEKSAADKGDVEMTDTTEAPAADRDSAPAATTTQTPAKAKARRKSVGGAKGKTLSKKGSKARLTHLDAQPGDHFLVKLKGFPAWPAIICDESMLPPALIDTRPVTAQRPDGTWNEPYADGGKRAYDRNFPLMYLYTNEL